MPKRNKEGEWGVGSGSVHDLPPLVAAYRIQEHAARVGFDWPDARGPIEKVKEELRELEAELLREGSAPHSPLPGIKEEIGDLCFAVVNLARKLGVDPSTALERSNEKFLRRFEGIERLARERGLELGRASLEELDRLWEQVKATE